MEKAVAVKKNSKKPSVRERAKKTRTPGSGRIRKSTAKVAQPLKKAHKFGQKEYHLPLPDNKLGRLLSKRGRLVPKFFKEAWAEIKLVTWPNRRETYRLTVAVFVFALVFGVLVALLDVGLDKVFKEVIIKR